MIFNFELKESSIIFYNIKIRIYKHYCVSDKVEIRLDEVDARLQFYTYIRVGLSRGRHVRTHFAYYQNKYQQVMPSFCFPSEVLTVCLLL